MTDSRHAVAKRGRAEFVARQQAAFARWLAYDPGLQDETVRWAIGKNLEPRNQDDMVYAFEEGYLEGRRDGWMDRGSDDD